MPGLLGTGLLDDFNRANEDPMAGNYNLPVGINGLNGSLTVVSNEIGTGRSGNAIWLTSVGPNCVSSIKIPTLPLSGAGPVWCYARLSSSSSATPTGYSCDFRDNAGTHTFRILRLDGGSDSDLGQFTQVLSANDEIAIACIGSDIAAYAKLSGNWTLVNHVTDSTYGSAGFIGFGKTSVDVTLDDHGGGTFIEHQTSYFARRRSYR